MTHIYFVRHAEPNYDNHDDSLRELSEKGMADRKLITSFLTDKEIDIVLSSPYKRAVDTIKEFADAYGYEIGIINDFRERKVDNCWIEDFYSFSKRQWEDFDYKLSDGETLHEVQNRNISALQQVMRVYKNKNIVIGSHGTALSTIINYFQPAFGFEDFDKIRDLMPWIVHFEFDGESCIKIEGINLFDETKSPIFEKEGGCMIIEIESFQGDNLLYGKKISKKKLQEQLVVVEEAYDKQLDNFIEVLCRRYQWSMVNEEVVPEFIYDRDTKQLLKIKH